MKEVRVEYYYDPYQKLWTLEVLDDEDNVVEFVYTPKEKCVESELKCLACKYSIKETKKVSFYK